MTPDCGSIDLPGFSSQAAFFQQSGTRSIQTQWLDLSLAMLVFRILYESVLSCIRSSLMLVFTLRTLSFRVRIGGSSGSSCETANLNEDVVVEYQPSGSSLFIQLKLLAYNGKTKLPFVYCRLAVA